MRSAWSSGPSVDLRDLHRPPVEEYADRLVGMVGASRGEASVADQVFTVSKGYGPWMPAGMVHAGRATAGALFHDAYFAPDRTPVAFGEPKAIAMTPLLESLLTHLSYTDLDAAARARAEAVVFDVLRPAERQFALQLPDDARIGAIAEALLDDPADCRSLEEWALRLGVSDRTVTRAFRQATGLSFAQWRQTLRVHRALTLLSEGIDVTTVSETLGYARPSSFIAAFRRVMGTTPGAFFQVVDGRDGVRNPVSGVGNS
ncbi:helix-turn-helix domain-containing protein [Streptomyces tendae]|uniref:helix-turn-helix domain-containing protein n=1 Tax=Streptomyces tendae TaxID=1932 RepID=UPI00380D485E